MKDTKKIPVHYFLVEFGDSGELYDVGAVGDKEVIMNYLYRISRCVMYKQTKEMLQKKIKGTNIIGDIIFTSCKFYCDMFQSFSRSKRIYFEDQRRECV